MKKILGVFILMLFVGTYSITAQTVSTTSSVAVVNKDKCPKCGSDKCDGKCDVHTMKGQMAADKKSPTGDTKSAKSGCSDVKTGEACANKSKACANKSKVSSKETAASKKSNTDKEKK